MYGCNQAKQICNTFCPQTAEAKHLFPLGVLSIKSHRQVPQSAFVIAAEAVGLGCCPISAIRNAPEQVSQLLNLPKHVFPVAGLALGYPADGSRRISPRLSLETTVHVDQYNDVDVADRINAYDERRNQIMTYANQRSEVRFGTSPNYGWSEDKARQYALEERQDFGRYVRSQGFDLS